MRRYSLRIVSTVTGTEMRRIRRKLRLTQVELAGLIGIKGNSVARQERGEIGISEPVARLVRLLARKDRLPRIDR
jgi:DNA-binding transcriptional regulator YiaG